MFNIGDIVIYSAHGVSKIDNICEKTYSNVTKTYYELHPIEQTNLMISTPVDNDKVVMLKMMDREEAEEPFTDISTNGYTVARQSKRTEPSIQKGGKKRRSE